MESGRAALCHGAALSVHRLSAVIPIQRDLRSATTKDPRFRLPPRHGFLRRATESRDPLVDQRPLIVGHSRMFGFGDACVALAHAMNIDRTIWTTQGTA
jgi:hypothetical protein